MAMPFAHTHSSAQTAVAALSKREAVSRQSRSRRLCGGKSAAEVLAPLPTSTSTEPIALLTVTLEEVSTAVVYRCASSLAVMHATLSLLAWLCVCSGVSVRYIYSGCPGPCAAANSEAAPCVIRAGNAVDLGSWV